MSAANPSTTLVAFDAMASPCEILVDGPQPSAAIDAAIDEVLRIERKFSRYRPDSVVAAINRGEAVDVDEETAALLDFAGQLWRSSDGLFDITSGVLRRGWDFRAGTVPSRQQLEAILPLVGWQQLEWRRPRIQLRAGMEIDFGGFGKEYAADRAAAVLRAGGIEHALVNLGGDIHVLGPKADGTPWSVAIRHPRQEGVLASIPVARGGIATSGDYERWFEQDGQRYCHILDPRTGWPVTAWQSITVLAPNATTAGALATIAMLEQGEALPWLRGQSASYLAVAADGSVSRHTAGSQ